MRVVKEVEFTNEEVEALTNEAVIKAAASAIGEPSDDECWDVDFNRYSSKTARIVKKACAEKDQEGTEA